MTSLVADSGSFRDPGGRVFSDNNRILRAVYPTSASNYIAFRESGLLKKLINRGFLIGSEEVDREQAGEAGNGAALVLEHPRIPFVSYPYEWSATMLKKAALLHLDIQLAALDAGFTLSDASAYNIQFRGTRPVFIDHLSFRPYSDGEIWAGHRQFCMQFLNPLILWDRLGISPNAWFRGAQEGISPEDLSNLLHLRDRFSFTILAHVTAQASMQKRTVTSDGRRGSAHGAKVPRKAFQATLSGLRDFVSQMRFGQSTSVWGNYANSNSYSASEASAKRDFVQAMVADVAPVLLFDLGCNSGQYSVASIEAGAKHVVGFDFDFGALEQANHRASVGDLDFLPLWLDAANPSPSQGWAQAERRGLNERAKADALIALAFVHHIAIGKNVPLDMVIDWLIAMAPHGVIEFPPKSDEMVQRLLANREDIFPDYNEQSFRAAVERHAIIVTEKHLTPNGRLLIRYKRHL
jgi:ribosomal protein L11 methylase PrmA